MISYLEGVLLSTSENKITLLTSGGVGYELTCTKTVLDSLPSSGEILNVFVFTHMTEHSLELFGFSNQLEKKLFKKLITVSGIGPKAAMSLLFTFEAGSLVKHITSSSVSMISKAQGIGNKTAKRLIVELKETLASWGISDVSSSDKKVSVEKSGMFESVVSALKNLGFKSYEINTAESKINDFIKEGQSIEEILKNTLSLLRKGIK